MMIPKHKFVEKNMDMLRELTKKGYISPTLLQSYHIYKSYMSVKHPSKMERYKVVANETKSSVIKVRLAVADMKKYVKD